MMEFKKGDRVVVEGYGFGWDGPGTVTFVSEEKNTISVNFDRIGDQQRGAFPAQYVKLLVEEKGCCGKETCCSKADEDRDEVVFDRQTHKISGDDLRYLVDGDQPRRHPLSQRYHELLKVAGDTHDRKQADYGRENDPFANVRATESWGQPAWVGAMIRLDDKVRRLQAHALGSPLANEGALDSFMDIAVYALIAHVLYEDDSKEEEGPAPVQTWIS